MANDVNSKTNSICDGLRNKLLEKETMLSLYLLVFIHCCAVINGLSSGPHPVYTVSIDQTDRKMVSIGD